jgi:maltooligosyltrehalose trehalohydrolase
MAAGDARPLGARPVGDGRVELRVWAPVPEAVSVRVGGAEHELEPEGVEGMRAAIVPAAPGDDYVLVADGQAWPDPCSRAQPEGVNGPSRVVDPGSFAWSDAGWRGLTLDDLVVYELHVGTFSDEGTFDGVVPYLDEIRDLGVTAIEVMPIATFPGERGWGYDGLFTYAPHRTYGGPDGFARLVDAAHAAGLGVILDVVYNHVGPGNEALTAFGSYFTDRYDTFWGDALDYSRPGVREWAIQNACTWVRDYHVDGLRLDAVHAIFDESKPHVLAELGQRVRDASPRALVISEMELGNRRPIEEWGHDAQWDDGLHHALHAALTGERDGYYASFGRVADVARELHAQPLGRLVVCAQNHDQVGNRALGDRLPPDLLRLASACVLLAPQIPLIFMGEEYAEPSPFQFFTDHVDPGIAEATREGRKREFESFAGFSGEVADPQDPATFERSKLSRRGDLRDHYRELLSLRRSLPREVATEVDENARMLRLRRGPVELVVDFASRTMELRR